MSEKGNALEFEPQGLPVNAERDGDGHEREADQREGLLSLWETRWLIGARPSARRAQAKGMCKAAQQSPKGMSANARTWSSPVGPQRGTIRPAGFQGLEEAREREEHGEGEDPPSQQQRHKEGRRQDGARSAQACRPSQQGEALPFQLDLADIRGRVARLDGVLDQVLKQHDYPPQIEALVCEAALLTALIGQTMKLRWRLSLQIPAP